MTPNLIPASLATAHQVGLLMLCGSLFFMVVAMLPSIARLRSARLRLYLRREAHRRLFTWGWLGLGLLWVTALAQLVVNEQAGWPSHTLLMLGLSVLFTLLFLFAQFGLQLQVVVSLENGNSERASRLQRALSQVLRLALLIAIAVAALDVAGPALVPADLFGALIGIAR